MRVNTVAVYDFPEAEEALAACLIANARSRVHVLTGGKQTGKECAQSSRGDEQCGLIRASASGYHSVLCLE